MQAQKKLERRRKAKKLALQQAAEGGTGQLEQTLEEEQEEDEFDATDLTVQAVDRLKDEEADEALKGTNRRMSVFLDSAEPELLHSGSKADNPYVRLAKLCHRFEQGRFFQTFIMCVILLASVLVGVNTYETNADGEQQLSDGVISALGTIDTTILGIFIFEIALKILAKELRPWGFWTDKGMRGWFASPPLAKPPLHTPLHTAS